MSGGNHVVRRVEWTEIFPWLMIFRVFRLSVSTPLLLLATVGVLLTPVGSLVASYLIGADAAHATGGAAALAGDAVASQFDVTVSFRDGATGGIPRNGSELVAPMWEPIQLAVHPFYQLFQRDTTPAEFFHALISGLWLLLVWSLLGGAITRVAVVRLGREEREGLGDALRFATRRFFSYFGCPLFSISGVVVIAVLGSIVGLAMRSDAGVVFAAVVWILMLLGGLLATILLLGLLFGWPLMWSAISAEEMGDVFEAAQRGYSYTYGRPLHYLFYAAVALLVGSAGFVLVQYFAAAVIELSYWSVSWGASEARLQEIARSQNGIPLVANTVIRGLNVLVLTIASAYRYSFFWSAAAGIYLLLRRDIDRTDFNDVYVLDEEQKFGLPPLATDEAGVPGVESESQD